MIILVLLILFFLKRNYELFLNHKKSSKESFSKESFSKESFSNEPSYARANKRSKSHKSRCDKISTKKRSINPHFVDIKYHPDYTDVITAMNDMAPHQKATFNLNCMPVKYTKFSNYEISKLISEFVHEFNKIILQLPNYRTANTGWDEYIPDPNINSGWDDFRKSMNLNPSLYSNAKTKKVYLVQYNNVTKQQTDIETKYTYDLILQKKDSSDQIVLKVSVVQPNGSDKLIIEEFSVIGFLNKLPSSFNSPDENNFTTFDSLEKDTITKTSDIISELLRKDKRQNEETKYRIAITDNFD